MSVESLSKPVHYTWENLGEPVSEAEPPFLAQTDVAVFECWKKCALKRDREEYRERNVGIGDLFRDIKYMLIGIESRTFMYDEDQKSFMVNPGTAIEGLTSEALAVYIEDFIECGNDVRLLALLLRNSKQNINYNKQGLVFEAMCSSLSTWLQAYRGMVVKIEHQCNLLELRSWLQPLRSQLRFIVNLCCPPSSRVLMDDCCPLPSGGELLTYIYNAAQMTAHSHIALLLYFFLEKCLNVYYRFIENWLFEGSCDDQYGEFFIESRNNLGSPLDRSYWRRAFSLNYEKVPVFLSDLADKIFICGKSLNLVKLCAPNDPLCKQLSTFYPPLTACLEVSALERLAGDYHAFVSLCRATDCAANPLQSPPTTKAQSDKHADLMERVKLQRDKSMSRVRAAQEEERMTIYQEKKKIFDIMKKEMEDAEKRKIEKRRKELAEEQQRLEELAQTALQDAARENEEKRRLIEYYKSISDLAEIRKLKAKWKAQRLHLHDKRTLFFADDKKSISNQLLQQKIADDVDNRRKSCIFKLDSNTEVEDNGAVSSDSRTTIDSNRLEEGGLLESEGEDLRTACVSVTPSCETFVTAVDSKRSLIDSESSSVEEKVSSTSIIEDSTVETTPVVSSTSIITGEEESITDIDNRLKVADKQFDSKTSCTEIDNRLKVSDNQFDSKTSSPEIDNRSKVPDNQFDSKTGCEEIDNRREIDVQYDSKTLYELYNVAHSEAQKNKMKVLEFEFDLKCSRAENDKYYEKIDSSSKDKVLEMKMSSSSEAIKERTLELEKACVKAVEARREAAQNRARVMSSEYDIIFRKEFEDGDRVERRKHEIETHNKMVSEREEVSAPNDVEVEDKPTSDKSKCMSGQYFNSDGRFIFNSIPLLVDITARKLGTSERPQIDVERVDLSAIHNCLHKSVSIPTEIQHVFANDAVLRLFLNNEKLLEHLQCIRKYFFFLDGEYGRILTGSLFQELELAEHPSVLLSRHRLNAILQLASGSFQNCSPFVERLSFFVREIPLAFLLTDPEVLNCLSMRYKLHWPLNIIISDDAILNYDKIFAFQLQLHRASWVLQQDFQILKVKGMLKSSHYRQLQIFRHTMYQFIRTFTNYITTIALEGSWLEFKQSLVKVDTLDALYLAHVKYVKMVNFRCLLNKRSQPLQKQIHELLRAILTFHSLLRVGEWVPDTSEGNHTHSAFPRLAHQFSVFLRVARFLVKYLKQLVDKGYQPHFDLLLTYLSANEFYG
ncbi:gamma-tubulin complex component 6 isoform X2 [Nilaparvata lugens]|uniref:gamma-tubulin complex component 6 isoform X2 n=1 Tax=Nilaparvata lugens TaxID=108931 RepID=UPI00193D7FEC|nr:gamma-tubulin complex component 6 isoform X2 [Nilaparvata lugens]